MSLLLSPPLLPSSSPPLLSLFVLGVTPPPPPPTASSWRSVCGADGARSEPHSQLGCKGNRHTHQLTAVYSSQLSLSSGQSLECVSALVCVGVCVCVSLCVDECVGVLHHFWWDIERCVCHRVGGWAVGGCAPPPSRCSSSSCSLCPSSPPRLRLLREPSTSPKAVSTPSSTAHITHWKHWKHWKVFVFSFPVNISKPYPQN